MNATALHVPHSAASDRLSSVSLLNHQLEVGLGAHQKPSRLSLEGGLARTKSQQIVKKSSKTYLSSTQKKAIVSSRMKGPARMEN